MSSPTLADIVTKYGLKVVETYEHVERLPSGSLALDAALGGGWAKGRINELWGAEHFGKSLIAMITIGRTVRMGGTAVLFDMEKSFDEKWARYFIDVDSEKFVLVNQHANTYAEKILDTIHALAENGVDLIVLDSKDALVFEAEVEGQTGQANMGIASKRFTYFAKRLQQIIGDFNTTFLFVSQIRANIGDQWHPETTSGGHALNHFCSIRFQMRTPSKLTETIGGTKTQVGNIFNGIANKNKTAKPYQTAGVQVREFVTAEGTVWSLDAAYEVIDFGTRLGLFTNASGEVYSGAGSISYSIEDGKAGVLLGKTKAEALETLRTEPNLLGAIELVIRQKMGWS